MEPTAHARERTFRAPRSSNHGKPRPPPQQGRPARTGAITGTRHRESWAAGRPHASPLALHQGQQPGRALEVGPGNPVKGLLLTMPGISALPACCGRGLATCDPRSPRGRHRRAAAGRGGGYSGGTGRGAPVSRPKDEGVRGQRGASGGTGLQWALTVVVSLPSGPDVSF